MIQGFNERARQIPVVSGLRKDVSTFVRYRDGLAGLEFFEEFDVSASPQLQRNAVLADDVGRP